jgi:hypothetical protein
LLENETQKRRSKVCGKSKLKSLNVFAHKRQKSDKNQTKIRQKSETGNGESEVENPKKKLVTLRYQVCVKKSLVTAVSGHCWIFVVSRWFFT